MLNTAKEQNEALIKQLVKEGYTDLGWANEGREFSKFDSERTQPLQKVDCSLYAHRGTHKIWIDHDHKEILHVDMSD
jgi:hypothetical protein